MQDKNHDKILGDLKQRHRQVYQAEGRKAFCIIHAGGRSTDRLPLLILPSNYEQIISSWRECMQVAADFWARQPT